MVSQPQRSLTDNERKQILSMDMNSFTIYLFRWLKENLHTDRANYRKYYEVGNLAIHLFPGEATVPKPIQFYFKLSEAIAILERRGLVVRALEQQATFSKICLTSIGMNSDVDDAVLLLVDTPEEIVAELEHKFGKLDDVVRQYYLESIRAYREELYISSVICLGAASERAIHWLTEAIIGVCPLETQKGIQKNKNRSINTLTDYLCDEVICNISDYDKRFTNKLLERLNGLARLYRENRNEAGHPQSIEQSWLKDDQEILLLHFRRYVATISEAIRKVVP